MEENFTALDLQLFDERNIPLHRVIKQLHFLKEGITKINLVRPATINDGIQLLNTTEEEKYIKLFDLEKEKYSITKFVPASGAASRMFKFLAEFINDFNIGKETINAYINRTKCIDLAIFMVGLRNFPFYRELIDTTKKTVPNFNEKKADEREYWIIKTMLQNPKFNFSNKPKAVLPFHFKNGKQVTPIEEHINESVFYAKPNEKTSIHFTISKEHQFLFEEIANQFPDVALSYSYQSETTDTLSVHPDNRLFRLENGKLFFRPGGHGALIENLNEIQADIVYIKNIDNVSHNAIKENIHYKKLLGGILIETQKQVFKYQELLDNPEALSSEIINEIIKFCCEKLNRPVSSNFYKFQKDYQIQALKEILNRPIRVCGMVKNEGEPGGGPFWVKHEDGSESLQIVESSQVDLDNPKQIAIVNALTHFNPVDIVCGLKNYKGEKFDLTNFIDHNAGFVVNKNKDGKPIKAYELPGLWNGAMAHWNTIFVEVPLVTFNPVKTINDLLKSSHQPYYES